MATAADIDVSAGLSLRDVLPIVNAAYTARTRQRVSAVYGPSLRLARDIESGAQTDVFITADRTAMEHLARRRLVRADTAVQFIRNQLVLVVPAAPGAAAYVNTTAAQVIRDTPSLALADPLAAPSGKFAQMALRNLGLWDAMSPRVTILAGGQGALEFLAEKKAGGAIVFLSQAARDPRVAVRAILPQSAYPPIVYSMAATENGKGWPEVSAYINFVRSEYARDIFEKFGFKR